MREAADNINMESAAYKYNKIGTCTAPHIKVISRAAGVENLIIKNHPSMRAHTAYYALSFLIKNSYRPPI